MIDRPSHNATFPDPSERTPTILIVEDELLIRIEFADYLRSCGFKVLEARHAREAILTIEGSGILIDLVFSDVQMPGSIDGFGLAKWIRKNRPGLPVILTSGDAKKTTATKELCENEPFMEKPYDLKYVVAQIRAHIGSTKKNT